MKVNGKTMWTRNPARVIRDAEWVLLYRDGNTLAAIGEKYGVSREYVRQQLAKLGLTRIDGGQAFTSLKKSGDKIAKANKIKADREARHFARYAMSREEMDSISSLPRSSGDHPLRKFVYQRRSARYRKIGWELTFADWWRIWQESGKWELRGRGMGYCMARWADDGPLGRRWPVQCG